MRKSKILGKLASHPFDTRHQLSILSLVNQRDKPVAHLQPKGIHRRYIVPAQLGGGRQRFLRRRNRLGGLRRLALPQPPGAPPCQATEGEEGEIWHTRHQTDDPHHAGGDGEGPRIIE